MEFNDLKCKLITNERSTISISWFQELWDSISDLNWRAELEQVDSSFAKSKQSFFSSCMMIWMKFWRLILHDLAGIFNCHECMLASTVLNSARNPWNLASILFNYAREWWFNQEQGNGFEEICRKVREEVWRDWWTRSRSEPNEMLIPFSVMIMFIYGFLMMLLITIKQMQVN